MNHGAMNRGATWQGALGQAQVGAARRPTTTRVRARGITPTASSADINDFRVLDADALVPARGIVLGVLISAVLWASGIIGTVVWLP